MNLLINKNETSIILIKTNKKQSRKEILVIEEYLEKYDIMIHTDIKIFCSHDDIGI
jgi:hypothetical protein